MNLLLPPSLRLDLGTRVIRLLLLPLASLVVSPWHEPHCGYSRNDTLRELHEVEYVLRWFCGHSHSFTSFRHDSNATGWTAIILRASFQNDALLSLCPYNLFVICVCPCRQGNLDTLHIQRAHDRVDCHC